jgi:hypothetical protein
MWLSTKVQGLLVLALGALFGYAAATSRLSR